MIETIRICDGCEKHISLRAGVKVFHKLNLGFETFMIDENTAMTEEVAVMRRNANTVYCEDCFKVFLKHMENCVAELGKDLLKVSQITVTGEQEVVSSKAIRAKQNFKAREGTVFIDDKTKADNNGKAIPSAEIVQGE